MIKLDIYNEILLSFQWLFNIVTSIIDFIKNNEFLSIYFIVYFLLSALALLIYFWINNINSVQDFAEYTVLSNKRELKKQSILEQKEIKNFNEVYKNSVNRFESSSHKPSYDINKAFDKAETEELIYKPRKKRHEKNL